MAASGSLTQLESGILEQFGVDADEVVRVDFGSHHPESCMMMATKQRPRTSRSPPTRRALDRSAVLDRASRPFPTSGKKDGSGSSRCRSSSPTPPEAVCFPDDRTIVRGTAELLRATLQRPRVRRSCPRSWRPPREGLDATQAVSLAVVVSDKRLWKEIPVIPDEILRGTEAITIHVGTGSFTTLAHRGPL